MPVLQRAFLASSLCLALAATVATAAEPAPPANPANPAPAAAAAPAGSEASPAPAAGEKRVAVSKATADQVAQMTCRTVKVTGSNVRTRRVCSTPDTTDKSAEWVRQQQDRGGVNASAILNAPGGG